MAPELRPREVQLEALGRSYDGLAMRSSLGAETHHELPHHGDGPARGWGHFMEMRLGKTATTLNEFLLLRRDHDVRKMLVLAPNKFKLAWQMEARRFGVDAPIHVYESSGSRRPFENFLTKITDGGVLVVNYEALRFASHNEQVHRFFGDDPFMLAMDESAIVKTPSARTSKAVLKIADKASYVRALSGMPAPYAPYDLWSQLRCLDQLGRFNNFYSFKHTFTKMGGFQGKQPKGIQNEEALDAFLYERCFRARKVDWGLTHGVDYELARVELTKEQKQAYSEMEVEFVVWLENGDHVTAENAMTKYSKLQQIASGFMYDEDGETRPIVDFEKTPKLLDLKDRLDNYIPGKVFVVAHHKATLRMLYRALKEYNPAYIIGGMSAEETERQKAMFNEDDSVRVILGQSQAVKYGHALVGSAEKPCYSICFFENSYNLDTRAQCEARPQGAHQTTQVHIWDYHSCEIETLIVRALQKRQKVSDVVMGFYKAA